MDIALTENGDFALGPDMDIAVNEEVDEIADDVLMRVRTYLGDYYLFPAVGNTILDLVGNPNTKDVIDSAVDDLKNALTYDSFLLTGEFEITGITVNKTQALFVIELFTDYSESKIITIPFDFTLGFI